MKKPSHVRMPKAARDCADSRREESRRQDQCRGSARWSRSRAARSGGLVHSEGERRETEGCLKPRSLQVLSQAAASFLQNELSGAGWRWTVSSERDIRALL